MALFLVFSRCGPTGMGQVDGLGAGLGEKQGQGVGRCCPRQNLLLLLAPQEEGRRVVL